jgi:hypothetical protein
MTLRPQAASLVLLVVILLGCSKTLTPTEVMVTVDAESGVRARTEQLHITVRGGQDKPGERAAYDRMFSSGAGDLDWPHLTALAPASGDAGRVYEIVATALDRDGNVVAQVRAISSYVAGKQLALRLLLEDSCIAKTCSTSETCMKGNCVTAMRDPATLALFAPKTNPSDGGPRSSNGSTGAGGKKQDAAAMGGAGRAGSAGSGGARTNDAGMRATGTGGVAGGVDGGTKTSDRSDAAAGDAGRPLQDSGQVSVDAGRATPGKTCARCTKDCASGYICILRTLPGPLPSDGGRPTGTGTPVDGPFEECFLPTTTTGITAQCVGHPLLASWEKICVPPEVTAGKSQTCADWLLANPNAGY